MASDDVPSLSPSPASPMATSRVDVFWHEGMLRHDAVEGVFDTGHDPGFLDVLEKHPENADRVRNMLSILRRGPIAPHVNWFTGRPAIVSELLMFHTSEYIDDLVEADKSGERHEIAAGTFMSPGSWEAALLAAGTTLSAMQHILDCHGKIAYALVRPPGHHSQPTQADGYCFLNNAALAVKLALNSGSCSRVAVIDIDVHYGNGTAEGFYSSDKVLTVSLHMNHGSWGSSHPQKGSIDEIGEDVGSGYNLNVPLPNGTGDRGYEYAMNELVVPAVRRFEPDMVVLVVGQDSSAFDPNGRQSLTMNGYRRIGQIMRGVAEEHSHGRLLMVQEGGYHVTYAAYCLHAMLEGVLKIPEPHLSDPIAYYPEEEAIAVAAVESIKRYNSELVISLRGT
ncbi:Histone deacetylase domain [Arabidopsis thaliana x Arabidopsis arenosa]|uniref:Histone deacetylase domain n=1 Tax=Arabidopsis thaliana x Arabidopsis arenosa TaxID=1240361 RepID=A0A8T2BW56_9BRAS|nr:Histone deacetylase domain [Arabidopsis thaliana x Arabidopsis arenosa]